MTLPAPSRPFLAGLRAALPVVLGYVPIGVAFGAVAGAAGFSALDAGIMSALVFAGASQFAGVGLVAAGYGLGPIAATTFLINLRHLIMSASLAPSFRRVGGWKSALLAYGITDETFAVSADALGGRQADPTWVAGLHVAAQASWVASSVAGAALGGWIPDARSWGLDFALPAMFIGLLAPHLFPRTTAHRANWRRQGNDGPAPRWRFRRHASLAGALVSAAVCVAWAILWPGGLQIVVAALAGTTVAWLLGGGPGERRAQPMGLARIEGAQPQHQGGAPG